jgi:hypothetical protein
MVPSGTIVRPAWLIGLICSLCHMPCTARSHDAHNPRSTCNLLTYDRSPSIASQPYLVFLLRGRSTNNRARAHTHTHTLSLSLSHTHTHTHTHTHSLTLTHTHTPPVCNRCAGTPQTFRSLNRERAFELPRATTRSTSRRTIHSTHPSYQRTNVVPVAADVAAAVAVEVEVGAGR